MINSIVGCLFFCCHPFFTPMQPDLSTCVFNDSVSCSSDKSSDTSQSLSESECESDTKGTGLLSRKVSFSQLFKKKYPDFSSSSLPLLHYMVQNNLKHELIDWLAQGYNLNMMQNNLEHELVDWLAHGYNLNLQDCSCFTPLHLAVYQGDIDLVELLLEAGADQNIQDCIGDTALLVAIKHKKNNVIDSLKEYKPRINVQNNIGNTVLHLAVLQEDDKLIDWIVQTNRTIARKLIIACDVYGDTPISSAIKKNNQSLMLALLPAIKETDAITLFEYGDTLMHYASRMGFLELVVGLIKMGYDCNVQDDFGTTPLHSAAKFGRLTIVKYLIKNKAQCMSKDSRQRTPLDIAAKNGNNEIVQYMLMHQENTSEEDH